MVTSQRPCWDITTLRLKMDEAVDVNRGIPIMTKTSGTKNSAWVTACCAWRRGGDGSPRCPRMPRKGGGRGCRVQEGTSASAIYDPCSVSPSLSMRELL